MSAWARSWAYEQRVGEWVDDKWRKNPGAKSVLAAICEFPDQDGRCYVGQQTLADMCDMSERSVRAHLSFLEHTAKLIKREERRRQDGTRTSDYIWILAPVERLRPPESHQPAKSAASDASTGKSRRINRQIMSHQPAKSAGPYIEEPSVDPLEEPLDRQTPTNIYSKVVQDCLALLAELSRYPKNQKDNAKHLEKLCARHPQLDIRHQVEKFCWHYEEQGFDKGQKPRARLATWLSNAEDWNKVSQQDEPFRRKKKRVSV